MRRRLGDWLQCFSEASNWDWRSWEEEDSWDASKRAKAASWDDCNGIGQACGWQAWWDNSWSGNASGDLRTPASKLAKSACWDRWDDSGRSSWQRWGESAWCSDARDHVSMPHTADDTWIVEPTGVHSATLIFFHSCHGRPQHSVGFVDDLRAHALFDEENLRIVSPCAPRRFTELDKDGTLQWFEYRTEKLLEGADQDDVDEGQLLEQRQCLLLLLSNELQKLPSDGRMVIGGLSQGASMAADLLLHIQGPPDKRLRGAFFKRGFVQRESVEDIPANHPVTALKELPLLATHGVEDDWVPFAPAQKSYDLLREKGGVITMHAIPGLKHNGYDYAEAQILAEFVVGLLKARS